MQIAPNLTAVLPTDDNLTLVKNTSLIGSTGFDDYPGLSAETARIQLSPAWNDTILIDEPLSDVKGNFSTFWNATDKDRPSGNYSVTFRTQEGFAGRVIDWTVPYSNATYPELTSDGAGSSLNGSEDADVYSYTFDGGCTDGSWFIVRASGVDGHDVDLYVDKSDPAEAQDDPANYSMQADGATAYPEISVDGENATVNETYSVMVGHKLHHGDYRVDVDENCETNDDDTDDDSGGINEPDPELVDAPTAT